MTSDREGQILELRDIHVAYVKKEILHGVSLTVHRGEIVALLGGNGSGKSTVLKTIAGLLRPTKGTVLFNGQNISSKTVHARQQMGIGFLLQGGRIFPNLTVAENLDISSHHGRMNPGNGQRPKVGDVFFVLRDQSSTRAGLLSGGQRQMLAIEMVLAQNPILALLDEPSAGLAPSLVTEILNQVSRIAVAKQMAVLLVEQNVEEARRIANHQLRLELGAVRSEEMAQI